MKLRIILAGTALAALVASPAAKAQVGGGTEVGGHVDSFLELILAQPSKGFAAFTKAKSYEMSFEATAITTEAPSLLTLADGDVTGGSKLGYLSVGSKRLPSPLEATIGKSAFQPLNSSIDPVLKRWSDVTSRGNGKATVKLRQKVKKKSTGNYRKVVLVTLSSETP